MNVSPTSLFLFTCYIAIMHRQSLRVTYNSIGEGEVIEVQVDLDVSVDLCDCDVNVLAQDLLDLLLDQSDPLPPQSHRRVLDLSVDVVQILGDGLRHDLVEPLEEGPAPLGGDGVALQGMGVAVHGLHVGENVGGGLMERMEMEAEYYTRQIKRNGIHALLSVSTSDGAQYGNCTLLRYLWAPWIFWAEATKLFRVSAAMA